MSQAIPAALLRVGLTVFRAAALSLVLIACAVLGLACSAGTAQERGPYRLGIGDEVRVNVQDQPQASGTATVGDDGMIAMPLLGRLSVEGLSLYEATNTVRNRLASRIVDPAVAVDVARYRPFFILGDVANPGMYPWFPGATVAQAIAVAGGYRGRSDYLQGAMAGIRAAEAIDTARYQLADGQAQEARQRAELSGRTIVPPPASENPTVSPMMIGFLAREQEILDTRSTGFAKQLDQYKREQEIRADEIVALEGRLKAQGRQADNMRAEIDNVRALIGRGLSPTSRLNDLNREESRLQTDTLQTQVLLNQARNGRNQAERQASDVMRERRLQLLNELQETVSRIQRLRLQLQAETNILLESSALQAQPGNVVFATSFRLQARNAVAQRSADEDTPIGPGDVLRVERLLAPLEKRVATGCEGNWSVHGCCPGMACGATVSAGSTVPTFSLPSLAIPKMAAPVLPKPAVVQPRMR